MDKKTVQQISELYGVRPVKGKGQHFLIDDSVVDRIVEYSGIDSSSKVLEIGPGFGVLTGKLAPKVKKLLVVELDDKLIDYLQSLLHEHPNAELIHRDILKVHNNEIAEMLDGEYEVVANIPYSITAPIIRKFTSYEPRPTSMTLMVQKEVGQRVAAKPGKMSILAVAAQFYMDVEYGFEVPRNKFWPEPAVDSAVIRMIATSRHKDKLLVDEKDFFRIVKMGFAARRKKLANTLSAGLRISSDEARNALEKNTISPDARAQELSVDDWLNLAHFLLGKKSGTMV